MSAYVLSLGLLHTLVAVGVGAAEEPVGERADVVLLAVAVVLLKFTNKIKINQKIRNF